MASALLCAAAVSCIAGAAAAAATAASADVAGPAPGTGCLQWQGDEDGCGAIRSRDLCLSARDGRPWREWKGRLVYGQPCAWCEGEGCGAGKACMPADWARGRANVTVADCAAARTAATPAARAPSAAGTLGGHDGFEDAGHRGLACGARLAAESARSLNNYFYTFTAGSLGQCKELCLSRAYCKGVDYEADSQECRLWWHPIETMVVEQGSQTLPGPGGRTCARVSGSAGIGSELARKARAEAALAMTTTTTTTMLALILPPLAAEQAAVGTASALGDAMRVDPGQAAPAAATAAAVAAVGESARGAAGAVPAPRNALRADEPSQAFHGAAVAAALAGGEGARPWHWALLGLALCGCAVGGVAARCAAGGGEDSDDDLEAELGGADDADAAEVGGAGLPSTQALLREAQGPIGRVPLVAQQRLHPTPRGLGTEQIEPLVPQQRPPAAARGSRGPPARPLVNPPAGWSDPRRA